MGGGGEAIFLFPLYVLLTKTTFINQTKEKQLITEKKINEEKRMNYKKKIRIRVQINNNNTNNDSRISRAISTTLQLVSIRHAKNPTAASFLFHPLLAGKKRRESLVQIKLLRPEVLNPLLHKKSNSYAFCLTIHKNLHSNMIRIKTHIR